MGRGCRGSAKHLLQEALVRDDIHCLGAVIRAKFHGFAADANADFQLVLFKLPVGGQGLAHLRRPNPPIIDACKFTPNTRSLSGPRPQNVNRICIFSERHCAGLGRVMILVMMMMMMTLTDD